jgi:hypothetical protein
LVSVRKGGILIDLDSSLKSNSTSESDETDVLIELK